MKTSGCPVKWLVGNHWKFKDNCHYQLNQPIKKLSPVWFEDMRERTYDEMSWK
ncbi:hypothetical protein [Flavitalea sp.]|nr:hypothetical protein [Flavitalea sp.]